MRSIKVKVLRDYDNGDYKLKEGQVGDIEFHINGNPTFYSDNVEEFEIDNIWDDYEFDSYFGEIE
jgi:hypothetical protein